MSKTYDFLVLESKFAIKLKKSNSPTICWVAEGGDGRSHGRVDVREEWHGGGRGVKSANEMRDASESGGVW